ncbi:response regulator [Microvirga sp. BT688]|uniref:response regulator n=1 Tax=Microvirga sp. TaxID=1873136 RepID=UPI0016858A02|nr:response regulator [Microvirga sp.]
MVSHPTALIIEADPVVQETLILVLKEAGYSVAGFESGEAALAALRAGIPANILVTEVRLPGLDGWQLARAVRRLRPDLPILYIPAVSGGRPQGVTRSFVLPKPFRSRAFELAVRLLASPPVTYH